MQTHCPHCDTKFRITETQVNIADGFVRCGVCQEVFNAFEVAEKHDHQHSLLDEKNIDKITAELEARSEDSIEETEEEEGTDVFQEIDTDSHDEKVDFNETSATDDSRREAFDFFDETVNESLPHVVPDKFRESHATGSHSITSTLLWSIGILLLTATLLIEYAWFNRDQFSNTAEVQTFIEQACEQFECKNISARDPSKIELVTRNVYSHPNEKGALMVNVTMKNNARYAQPYPIMQVDFSNIRGSTVAARRFLPSDYLPEKLQTGTKQVHLLEPDASASVSLEIQDPGKQAMTYEFNFM